MKLKYVDTATVINRLIESTNNTYDVQVWRGKDFETVMNYEVTLTIPGLGTRTHIGVQKMYDSRGNVMSEDMLKGGISDGLKKAASLFGVAKELYGPDYEQLGKPVALTNVDKLSSLLRSAKVTKLSQVNALSQEKYGADFANLNDEAINEWLGELERAEPVPF
jgi:hypothetical protein